MQDKLFIMFSHKGGAKTPLPAFYPHKKSFHECFWDEGKPTMLPLHFLKGTEKI